jgi:ankyrin repeat protein
MRGYRIARAALGSFVFAGALQAQTAGRVDFGRDVLPILRQNCVTCHSGTQPASGMRLDRKSAVINRRGIVPGSAENSFLFHRISGNDYGMQMPPTGALKPEQIDTIKRWIEQGADWPDALADEAELPPVNPKAVAMVDALHEGDLPKFMKFVAEDAKLLNARGPEGSTPFMYAVLYTNAATLERLLRLGADPNKRNDANATALMWAATEMNKTKMLLSHGADVNARSRDMRTPLMIAARKPGNSVVVKLLLDKGANPNPNLHPSAESSPLLEAANAGDAASVEMLIGKGAEVKPVGEMAINMAVTMECSKCLSLLTAKEIDEKDYSLALADIAITGDVSAVKMLLDHGADVNIVDPLGRTALMYAAASDNLPLEVVKMLVEHGADVNAKDAHKLGADSGWTALDIARQHASAIQGSLPLIQKADANFMPKAACASCHNNSFAAMAVGSARRNGFAVDEKIAAQQVQGNVFGLMQMRDNLRQGFIAPVGEFFGPVVIGDMLLGLEAEHYNADLNTDTAAIYLKNRQGADGHWAYLSADTRPPICSDYIAQTAIAMRAMQLYAPKLERASYDQAIQLAAEWLAKQRPKGNEDRVGRLTGLVWSGKYKDAVQKAMYDLIATQRSDGGWADIDTTPSTAFATGRALVALQTAGLPVSDGAYQKGVKYLLSTQQEDGSWFVRSRSMTFQPYFDSGFPHGFDQWISAAGTSWATLALSLAAPAHTPNAANEQ